MFAERENTKMCPETQTVQNASKAHSRTLVGLVCALLALLDQLRPLAAIVQKPAPASLVLLAKTVQLCLHVMRVPWVLTRWNLENVWHATLLSVRLESSGSFVSSQHDFQKQPASIAQRPRMWSLLLMASTRITARGSVHRDFFQIAGQGSVSDA